MSHIKTIRIHSKIYDERHPAVVASSGAADDTKLTEDVACAVRLGCDLFEWRADLFHGLSTDLLLKTAACLRRDLSGIPLLFTCRTGGLYPSEACVGFYKCVLAAHLADAVDAELPLCDQIPFSSFAKEGTLVILSEHFFDDADEESLARAIRRMDEFSCDVIKLAGMTGQGNWPFRAERLNALTDRPLCLIAMGEAGQAFRRRPWLLHSVMTYGYASEPTAPGQAPVSVLLESCRKGVL